MWLCKIPSNSSHVHINIICMSFLKNHHIVFSHSGILFYRLAKLIGDCTWHMKENCGGRHSPAHFHYVPNTPYTVNTLAANAITLNMNYQGKSEQGVQRRSEAIGQSPLLFSNTRNIKVILWDNHRLL